jgi:hypothetical protein
MVKNVNTFLDLARNELLERVMALKISEREAYKTAEMTSWYYYLLKSKVLCLCHYKLATYHIVVVQSI